MSTEMKKAMISKGLAFVILAGLFIVFIYRLGISDLSPFEYALFFGLFIIFLPFKKRGKEA